MSFILFEVWNGRNEELATFEKRSRAVEVATALKEYYKSIKQPMDYEVVGYDGSVHFTTISVQHPRRSLEVLFDQDDEDPLS